MFAGWPDQPDQIGVFLDLNPIGGAGLSEADACAVEFGADASLDGVGRVVPEPRRVWSPTGLLTVSALP